LAPAVVDAGPYSVSTAGADSGDTDIRALLPQPSEAVQYTVLFTSIILFHPSTFPTFTGDSDMMPADAGRYSRSRRIAITLTLIAAVGAARHSTVSVVHLARVRSQGRRAVCRESIGCLPADNSANAETSAGSIDTISKYFNKLAHGTGVALRTVTRT
jgi:hypothetical protein